MFKFSHLIALSFLTAQTSIASTGPYEGYVQRIQATSVGNPYNTIYLELDVSESPCTSTNQYNRFTLASDAQYSLALAAFMADKAVKIYGTGNCVSNIEQINNMQVQRNQ